MASEAKLYPPGPYCVDPDTRNGGAHQVCYRAPDGRLLTLCFVSTGWGDQLESLAIADLFASAPRLVDELEKEERAHGQTIDERDHFEAAIGDIHRALGGDGEWACRIPEPNPPESGDLCRDCVAMAEDLVTEHAALADALKSIQYMVAVFGHDRLSKDIAAKCAAALSLLERKEPHAD